MRTDLRFFALLGLANASSLISRQDSSPADFGGGSSAQANGGWKPKTDNPSFFSLAVDAAACADGTAAGTDGCGLYIRLLNGKVIATPYNKWWDPKLPIFFVDDDTKVYTVSKQPLELYVDSSTGALSYSPVGWLPSTALATGFYHTGDNPLGALAPSSAYLGWPIPAGLLLSLSAQATTPFYFCPLGVTGQYQVFVSNENYLNPEGTYSTAGLVAEGCTAYSLAALDANPFARSMQRPQTGGNTGTGTGTGVGVGVGAGTGRK